MPTLTTNAVDLLLGEYWDGHLPVDVGAIARKIGINLKPCFGCEDGASGYIQRFEGDRYEIGFDMTQNVVRQRFTIAHELGHFALGHLNQQKTMAFRDKPASFFADVKDPKETAANKFAAQLLMPERMVKYVIEREGVTSVAHMANIFNVSQAAMDFRIRGLGIVPPNIEGV